MAVFAALLIFDLIAHKRMKLGRKAADWLFLCAFVFGLVFSCVNALFPLLESRNYSGTGQYIACRYLMDGDSSDALDAVRQDGGAGTTAGDMIEILADAASGDYEDTYYRIEEFTGTHTLSQRENEAVYSLYDLVKKALSDGTDISADVMAAVEKSFDSLQIRQSEELSSYYELHKKITSGDTGITASDIQQMLADFPYDPSVMKAAITWFVNSSMFDEAEDLCMELIEEDASSSSQIIYTDVIAQRAYASSDTSAQTSDATIQNYYIKAEESMQRALTDESRYDAFMHEADTALESARYEMLKRVKNYITVKLPVTGDNYGLYDLQLIKMDLLMNDLDGAYDRFEALLEKVPDISPDSPIYNELTNISAGLESYISSDDSEKSATYERLKKVVYRLFNAQSQGVVGSSEGGINERAAQLLLSILKYSRPEMVITSIDTSAYPRLNVSFEMNIGRKNIFGKDGEFYKDDFEISDTGLEIAWDDVTLQTSVGSGDTALCAVVDVIDTDGSLKKEVSQALIKLIDGTDKRAVAGSDGTILCGFDDQARYYTAARELDLTKDGDSHTALMSGLSLFEGNRNSAKCLLWITNRAELDTSLRQEIIDKANELGVSLYIIYTGEEDPSMYRGFAASASGAVFGLEDPAEMMACACEITDLMDNRYEITYRVANSSATQRNILIEIPDRSLSGSESYTPEVTG